MNNRQKIFSRMQGTVGFTLLEMAIVLCIAGLLMSMALPLMKVYENRKDYDQTHENLQKAHEALKNYLHANSALPCPAGPNVAPGDSSFGKSIECFDPLAKPKDEMDRKTGLAAAVGRDKDMVSIGLLPFRSLGLSDAAGRDGWNNILNYAVTQKLTDPFSYAQDGGALDIVDENGNSRIVPPSSFQYVIFSSGPNGAGAFSPSGVSVFPCDTKTLEGENCNKDAVFLDTGFRYKSADGLDRWHKKVNSSQIDFDDLMFYKNFDFALTGLNYQYIGKTCPSDFAPLKLRETTSVYSEISILSRGYPAQETRDKTLCYSPFYSASLSLNVRRGTSNNAICPEGWKLIGFKANLPREKVAICAK